MLVTVSGGVANPGVYEIEVGTTLAEVISGAGGAPQGVGGVLVGGYSGTWLGPEVADTVPLHPSGLAAVGGIVGAGVVAVLPEEACGWSETASVLRWLAGQTAGQCGPCVHGLAAIAGAAEQVVSGRGGDATLGRLTAGWTTSRAAAHAASRRRRAVPAERPRGVRRRRAGPPPRPAMRGLAAASGSCRCPNRGGRRRDASARRPDRVHGPRHLRASCCPS